MNEKQQIQGYKCDSCLTLFSFGGVKRCCLDNNKLGVKMYCVICPPCSQKQFWSKERLGYFPLLPNYLRNQEIKTPEFIRHEEDERIWQIKTKGLFKCDYCSQLIPLTQEIVYDMTRHELNTPEIAYIKYSLVCSPCRSSLDKDLDKGRLINYSIFDWSQIEAEKGAFPTFKTDTLIEYEKCKKQLGKDEKPMLLP